MASTLSAIVSRCSAKPAPSSRASPAFVKLDKAWAHSRIKEANLTKVVARSTIHSPKCQDTSSKADYMTQENNGFDARDLEPLLEDGRFLIDEGLDLLAAFRAIKNAEARKAILTLIASIAEAEIQAECRGHDQLR